MADDSSVRTEKIDDVFPDLTFFIVTLKLDASETKKARKVAKVTR